jgi:hypothetical protein
MMRVNPNPIVDIGGGIDVLPSLCIWKISQALLPTEHEEYYFRPLGLGFRARCDVVRDLIAMRVACGKNKKKSAGLFELCNALASEIDPPSPPEDLVARMNVNGGGEEVNKHSRHHKSMIRLEELKDACRRVGMRVSGNKAELCGRLVEYVRVKAPRDPFSGVLSKTMSDAAKEYIGFAKHGPQRVALAYGLEASEVTYFGTRPATRNSVTLALERKFGGGAAVDVFKVRECVREKSEARERTRAARVLELATALHERDPALKIRNDSEICGSYVSGTSEKSLTEVVDIMEHMHFLYTRTSYPYILRKLRSDFRAYEGSFDERLYWKIREAYRDGVDLDEYTASEELNEEIATEEAIRRKQAKEIAVERLPWVPPSLEPFRKNK